MRIYVYICMYTAGIVRKFKTSLYFKSNVKFDDIYDTFVRTYLKNCEKCTEISIIFLNIVKLKSIFIMCILKLSNCNGIFIKFIIKLRNCNWINCSHVFWGITHWEKSYQLCWLNNHNYLFLVSSTKNFVKFTNVKSLWN